MITLVIKISSIARSYDDERHQSTAAIVLGCKLIMTVKRGGKDLLETPTLMIRVM